MQRWPRCATAIWTRSAKRFRDGVTALRIWWLVTAATIVIPESGLGQPQAADLQWPQGKGLAGLPRLDLRGNRRLVIGTPMGSDPTTFSGVAGATRLSGGRVAVGDAGNYRVQVFDSAGRFLGSLGRKGSGPGEFGSIRWLGRCSNGQVGVQESSRGALEVFDVQTGYQHSDPFPPEVLFDPVVWCSGAGRLVILLNRPRLPKVEAGQRITSETAVLRVRNGVADTVLRPGPQDFYVGKRVAAYGPVPLGRRVVAAAAGGWIVACATLSGRCSVLDTTMTGPPTDFTLSLSRRRLGPGDWDRVVAAYSDDPDRAVQQRLAALVKEFTATDTFPLIDDARVDARGLLWVRTFDNYGTTTATWVIVTRRGMPVALVALPRSLTIHEIGTTYVLGGSRDQEGVERVELFQYRMP